MKSKLIAVIFIFFALFLYFFAIYDVGFHGADEPVYFAYTTSVVEDGDLNIVNQVYSTSGRFVISKTNNFPDFHNHGGVILWAPFYIYAKLVYFITNTFNLSIVAGYGFDRIVKCVLSFSTVIFGSLVLIFTYFLCRLFFSRNVVLVSILALFLGTPFFYYMLVDVGNANIVASLFSVLSIWFCFYITQRTKLYWFLYGVFFSICVTVKTELWFQLIFVFIVLITLLLRKKIRWLHILYFIVGLMPITALRAINAYLKYGLLHMEEVIYLLSGMRYGPTYCFNGLFNSYRGIFYTSPILYICFLGFIFMIIDILQTAKKRQEIKDDTLFFFGLVAYLGIKLFLVGKIFSPGGDALSARLFLTEFPIFVLLFAFVFKVQRKYLKYIIFFTIVSIIWNLLIISEFMVNLDWAYITGVPGIISRVGVITNILDFLFFPKEIDIKLKTCLPLVLLLLIVILYVLRSKKQPYFSLKYRKNLTPGALFLLFILYLSLSYSAVTMLNLWNNRKNAERLKNEGFFENAKIIKSSPIKMDEIEEEEHLWTIFEMMRFYVLKERKDMFQYVKDFRERMFGRRECERTFFFKPIKAYFKSADYYKSIGRYQKAINLYKNIISMYPNDVDALISLGDIYLVTDNYENAIEALEDAFRLAPFSLNACSRLAEAYYKINNFEKSIEYCQKYLRLDPAAAGAYVMLGGIYVIKHNYLKAIEYFSKALQLNPQLVEIHANLADAYNRIGSLDKAIESYKKALQLNPNFADAYLTLGYIYNNQANYNEAIEYFKKALQLNPNFANAYCGLGDAYNKKGDIKTALKQVIKLRELERNALADELEKSIRQ